MHLDRNGTKISFRIDGEGNSPTVVMSHSLASSSMMWDVQIPALLHRYRVVRFDTRGHGDSDAPHGAYDLEQLSDDAIAVIEANADQPVHWVGLSMGGMIGQYIAMKRPDLLRSLVLCDTSAQIPPETQPAWDDRLDQVRDGGMNALSEATIQRWFTPNYIREEPPAVMAIRAQIETTSVAGYIGCVEAIRKLDILDRIGAIELPTLVIVGEDDPGTPVSAADAIHARISGSELVILPNASHFSNVEQADAFTDALMEFLLRH